MRNLEFNDGTSNWVQVQKRTAKRLFEQGEELVFCPCKLRPFGTWYPGVVIDTKRYNKEEISFESCVANFEYYNTSTEQGLYTTFYKKSIVQPL